MSTRKASDSNLTGKKYNDASAGATKIVDVPGTPTIGAVTAGNASVTVAYTAGTKGGIATTFTATSSPGSLTGTGASPITVSGLTNDTAYTFTVTGSNSTGTSPASTASASATPFLSDTGAMFPLGMVQVGSGGSAYLTFTSIPQTYTHLQLRMLTSAGDSDTEGYIEYNGDYTTSNYYANRVFGNGGATGNSSFSSTSYIFNGWGTGNGSYVASVVDILDYSSTTKTKVTRNFTGFDLNSSSSNTAWIGQHSSTWNNTNAITSLRVRMYGSNFNQFTQATLYGIK